MNIYENTARFFVKNPIKIFLLFVILTIGLTLSYLFIPYRGDASTSPKDSIIELDIKISEEFSDEVHFGLFIIETKNGEDILSKDNLFEIFKSTEKLREEDSQKKLSPESISDTEHLFKYVDSETGAQI
jgi:predicted RND superfamily exporter protein